KRREAAQRVQSEQKIIDDLSLQLETSKSILDLAANQVQIVRVTLFVSIDPLIQDEAGKHLIPETLAAKIVKAAQEDDDVSLFGPVTHALRKNYVALRQLVFKNWEFDFRVRTAGNKELLDDDMWERVQQQDGLKSFVISHVSEAHYGVQCWLSY